MAKIFKDEELRTLVIQKFKFYAEMITWLRSFCQKAQPFHEWDREKYAAIQLHAEELAYLIVSTLRDVHFIKDVTPIHPLHITLLPRKIYSHIENILFYQGKNYSITDNDYYVYTSAVFAIVMNILKYTDGEAFFQAAIEKYDRLYCNPWVVCDPWDIKITEEALDDFSYFLEMDDSGVIESIISYCLSGSAVREYNKTQENQNHQFTLQSLCTKIDNLYTQLKNQRPTQVQDVIINQKGGKVIKKYITKNIKKIYKS